MKFRIDIQNDLDFSIQELRLRKAACVVLGSHEVDPDTCVTIVLTNDEVAQSLNRQFRGINTVTDILSFPADLLPDEIVGESAVLGDLVIAYPYAAAQATREGHAIDDDLDLLVIHGILHLLGYNHDTVEHRAEMWGQQEKFLRQLGIAEDIMPDLEGAADD